MKLVRSILGVLVGCVVAVAVIWACEAANGLLNPPPGEGEVMERIEKLKEDKQAMKAWVESLPVGVMVALVLGWQLGAFLGGFTAVAIARRAPLLHAGFPGAWVLFGTIFNLYIMKQEFDYTHPDWVLFAALLMPLPMSMLGGVLAVMWFPGVAQPSADESKT